MYISNLKYQLIILGLVAFSIWPSLVLAQRDTGYDSYGLYIEDKIIDKKLYQEQKIKSLKEKHKKYIDMIQKEPNNPTPLFYLGSLYMELNQPKQAIPAFVNSLKLEPKNPETHIRLGKAYYKLGDLDQAINHIELAKNIFKDDLDLFGETRIKPFLKLLKKKYPKNKIN